MAFSRAAALRSCFRGARSTFARPQFSHQIARRGYASGGHGSAKSGGDAVWAAGAVAVTIPSCWYLLSNAPDASHHDSHGEEHGEHKEHEEEPKEEEPEKPEATEEKSEDSEKSDDSGDEKKDADTPETSDDESGDESDKDEVATSKPASSSKTEQSGKQEGLSNADTKHSTDNSEKSTKADGQPETGKEKGTVDPKREQK